MTSTTSIQRYMLMVLATNALVGLLTWMAMSWIGLENAGAWAVAAGVCCTSSRTSGQRSLLHRGQPWRLSYSSTAYRRSCSSPGRSLAIATLVGTFVTTWMTGQDRPNEHRSGIRHAALLDMAVGRLGHAAELSDHGDRQGRGRERRATSACG
jgi:hypothetical protein